MLKTNGKDCLKLVWKDPDSRKNYVVGELEKNGGYIFRYGDEYKEAEKVGFEALASFEDMDAEYKSDKLFPAFSSRLPDRKRTNIQDILKKYGLEEYDEYQLLKKSGAKLPIDNLEFIDPIGKEKKATREFFVSGARYYIECDGVDCQKNCVNLETGTTLRLSLEDSNEKDSNAIMLLTKEGKKVGYVPRYYCVDIRRRMLKGETPDITVVSFMQDSMCSSCIRVRLVMRAKS